MRGRGFLVWHPKMDEYMEALDGHLDEISERLITLGGKPYSTLTEFLQHSEIEEEEGEFRNVEESLERVLAIYRYLITLFQKALDVTDEEGDDVTNDILENLFIYLFIYLLIMLYLMQHLDTVEQFCKAQAAQSEGINLLPAVERLHSQAENGQRPRVQTL